MNFEIDEDQLALADSLKRLLADQASFERRRERVRAGDWHDPVLWAALADLGLTGLALPEAHGGFGGGARLLMPVMEALGHALSLEPLLPNLLAARAIALVADEEQQARLLPPVSAGRARLAFAHDEAEGRHAPLWVRTRARRTADGWRLEGDKSPVAAVALADRLVVSARIDGSPDSPSGCALFLVDPQAEGVHVRGARWVDDRAGGEMSLRNAPAEALGDPDDYGLQARALHELRALGIAAACADMVGAAQAAFTLAMDYLGTRKQFGRFIGENQALRHRAAQMFVSLEMARSMAIAAAVAADDPDGEDARIDLSRAKLSVGRHARLVAQGAIQLHGGIGMTEEYAVGHSLRRVHVMDQLFGDADAHAAELARGIE